MSEQTTIETCSGRWFDYRRPEVNLEDIAHALAHTCRFGGHVARFYSVAEHACLVAYLVNTYIKQLARTAPGRLVLAALHHDSHEAYLGDLPTPLKRALNYAHEELADRIDAAVAEEVELIEPADFEHELIKQADHVALLVEANALKSGPPADWRDLRTQVDDWRLIPSWIEHWSYGAAPLRAKQKFLNCHAWARSLALRG